MTSNEFDNLEPVSMPPEESLRGWRRYDLSKIVVLIGGPLMTLALLAAHLRWEPTQAGLWVIAAVLYVLAQLSISAGYHRLFAHRAFKAHPLVRAWILFFGVGAMQNSALKWVNDHRRHHTFTDDKEDPHPVTRGFFYVHMGWVMGVEKKRYRQNMVRDLMHDPLLRWQHRHYGKLLLFHLFLGPWAVGSLLGAPVGGVAILGLLKTFAVLHATFTVNSLSHWYGPRPFDPTISARENLLSAVLAMGEGYHNFHHTFPSDYRQGFARQSIDPGKWLIWSLSRMGLAWDLRRTSDEEVARRIERNRLKHAA